MAQQSGRLSLDATREKRESKHKPPAQAKRLSLDETRSRREEKRKASPVPPLVGNQYFQVYFGSTRISFARVSNVQSSVDHEDLAEGGLNDYIHVLTKPGGQSSTLTLERGVSASGEVNAVMKALAPGTRISVPVSITLYHRAGDGWKPVRAWGFEDGMVTRWEVSNLDGLGTEVVIEKLEISHAGLKEISTGSGGKAAGMFASKG